MHSTITQIIDNITPYAIENGIFATKIPDLEIIRSDCTTEELWTLHKPAMCIVLQGKKRVMLGRQIFDYDVSKYLSVSFDLPLTGRVIEASKQAPYLCVKLNIDSSILADLVVAIHDRQKVNSPTSSGLHIEQATQDILDPIMRLTSLLNNPEDIEFLAPLIKREILYRLLSKPAGHHLMAQSLGVGKSKQIAKAIAWIKANAHQPFSAENVAREAHLSLSAFHKHFKIITLMSPLQFQKKLRLQEARSLMAFEGVDATTASSLVGYESPSQFNREYKRAYGASPKADVAVLIKNNATLSLINPSHNAD